MMVFFLFFRAPVWFIDTGSEKSKNRAGKCPRPESDPAGAEFCKKFASLASKIAARE